MSLEIKGTATLSRTVEEPCNVLCNQYHEFYVGLPSTGEVVLRHKPAAGGSVAVPFDVDVDWSQPLFIADSNWGCVFSTVHNLTSTFTIEIDSLALAFAIQDGTACLESILMDEFTHHTVMSDDFWDFEVMTTAVTVDSARWNWDEATQ